MGKVEVDGGGDVYVAVKAHDGVNDEVNLKVGDPDRTLCSTLLEPRPGRQSEHRSSPASQ